MNRLFQERGKTIAARRHKTTANGGRLGHHHHGHVVPVHVGDTSRTALSFVFGIVVGLVAVVVVAGGTSIPGSSTKATERRWSRRSLHDNNEWMCLED